MLKKLMIFGSRYLQVVLSFEGLCADGAAILSLIAVSQLVFSEGGGVAKDLVANLKQLKIEDY